MRVSCLLKNHKKNADGDLDDMGVYSDSTFRNSVKISLIDTDEMVVDGYELIEAIKNCMNNKEI